MDDKNNGLVPRFPAGRKRETRAVTFGVSLELLADALGMPVGTKIFWAEMIGRGGLPSGELALYVEHPDLPVVKDGERYPTIIPLISIIGERPSEAAWIEWDWNLGSQR